MLIKSVMRILSQCIIITKYTLNTLQFYLLIILNKAEKIKVHLNLKHSYLTSKSCIVLFFSNSTEVQLTN